jgi:hypothetical protein
MDTEPANPEKMLYQEISALIEQTRRSVYARANSATIMLFWQIGGMVNSDVLKNKRADYGKRIVVTLSRQLTEKYSRSFDEKNLRRLLQFAEQFSDKEIVVSLSRQF